MTGWYSVLSCCLVYLGCWLNRMCCTCPWEEHGLLHWSSNDTWGGNGVPREDSQVTIPSGKRVLLDAQPANLTSLTIEAGAALVWGDVDGLTLDTHYILVKGEFHMGSQSCRFEKGAHIKLRGVINDSYEVTEHRHLGRKFIGVAANGTLELHGKLKTPWTKLAQTVKLPGDVDCAAIYDHSDFSNNKAGVSNQIGLNVLIWNEDGSFLDFSAFKDYDTFPDFFTSIPDGKVVGMYTFGSDGIGTKTQSLQDTIVSMGGKRFKDVQNTYGYSFLGRKGSNSTVTENVRTVNNDVDQVVDFLHFEDQTRHLVFQVAVNEWTAKRSMMFGVLHSDIAFPKLTLVDEVTGWEEGDEVLLLSTDYDWQQAETRRIIACNDCTSRQIKLDSPLEHVHYGNFTYGVDERGEVALLSKSIVIEGMMEDSCTERTEREIELQLCTKFSRDTFGGHLKVTRGFKSVHIRGVKLLHMGQQAVLGSYPIHFHMCDDVSGTWVRENVVLDSLSRCFTIHGTHRLELSNNVCYKHRGHGVFLEDAVEQNTTIVGNLVAGTMHGTLLMSDRPRDWCKASEAENCNTLASFWVTHPNNNITSNVAAGGEGEGFMIVFADLPTGPSRQRQEELNITHHPKDMPLLAFSRNVAHSNSKAGVHMDEKISTGTGMENKGDIPETFIIRMENEYDPHINGSPVWTEMTYLTFYKNGIENMWIKGGNVKVAYSALADTREGFTGGTTLTEGGTQVYKCLFIGETDNVGEQKNKTDSLTAVSIYQGPVIINSCFFDRYRTVSWCEDEGTPLSECASKKVLTRHSGAISFKHSNTYPTMTSTYAVNNAFGFCDNEGNSSHWVFHGTSDLPDWVWKDGNKGVFLRDSDGLLTGTVNASIVPNFPLFSGDECQKKKDWGDMLVCPYRYVKMEITGRNGNLARSKKDQYPMIIRRDDSPYNESYSLMGEIRNEYLLRTHRSYILDFNKTLDGAEFPDQIKVFGYGVEKGDVVRVGICQPKDVTGYNILMTYPVYIKNNATWVQNLTALDEDTTGAAFFHDKENGILFFKMLSFHQDTNDTQQCPGGNCFKVIITPQDGTFSNVRKCGKFDITPIKDNTAKPQKPTTPSCPGTDKPEEVGAVDWANVGFIEHEEFSVPCINFDTPPGRTTPQHLGCYKEKSRAGAQELKTNEMTFLFQSMNVDYCVNRCYYRQYQYAGLSRGTRCTCGHSLLYGTDFSASGSLCGKECRGNATQTCGASKLYLDVWSTGL